jgi:hypothetical protein
MTEALGLPGPRFPAQTEGSEEGEEVLGEKRELEPDLVMHEGTEGELAEAGVLATADAVLTARPPPVAKLEGREVLPLLVCDEDLEAVALQVSEGELGARMRLLAATDGPRALRPLDEVVEAVGQLAYLRSRSLALVRPQRRHPVRFGGVEDGPLHAWAQLEPDRELESSLAGSV